MWAQRNNCIFLTICLEDCKEPIVKIEPSTVYFKGTGGTDKKEHELTIDLNENIDPEKSLHVVRDRGIELCLKKVEENYWPRLTKSSQKKHWLKIDFNKWKEEDESDDEAGAAGGMGGMGGMPGMGGMGGMGGLGGMGGGDMDFEKMMKEMGGLGGAGMGGERPDFGDLDNNQESDSDDDDALPELE